MLFKTKIEGSLDIGSSSIKGVVLKGKAIDKYAFEPLPQGAILSGNIEDHQAVRDSLKSIISKLGLKNKGIVISLPVQNFAVKFLKIPLVGQKEKKALVESELEDVIPNYEPENYLTEFLSIGSLGDLEDIVAVAIQKDKVRDMVESLTFAKVKPVKIIPDFISLFNLIQHTKESVIDKTENASIMVVDIGAEATKIFVEKDGVLKMQRIAAIGGNDFTDVIERNQNMDYFDAERYKKKLELKDEDEDDHHDEYQEISELIEELNAQIKRSIEYYKAQEGVPGIDGLIVTGGPSMMKGYQNILENSLIIEMKSFPIERYLARCRAEVDELEDLRRLDIVVGNVINEIDGKKESLDLNFLTKEYGFKLEAEKVVKIAGLALVVALVVEGGAYQYLKGEIKKQEKLKTEYNDKKLVAENKIKDLEKQVEGIPDLTKTITIFDDIFNQSRIRFSDMLYELKTGTPRRLWYTNLEYKEGKIILAGTAADNNKDGVTSEISVLTLEKNLRNSKLFKDVKAEYIKSSDELGNPVNTFQYELKINQPADAFTTVSGITTQSAVTAGQQVK